MKKVLVLLHRLELGGSIMTAIDLAAGVRGHGWESTVYAAPGPLLDMAEERRLRVIPARTESIGISPRAIATFRRICRREQPDLVHAWDWPMILNAYYGAHLGLGVPLIGSVTAMYPPTILPPDVTLSFVTERIRAGDYRRPAPNFVLDPPVNPLHDDPSIVDADAFRAQHRLTRDNLHVVIVSRLDRDMKLDGILRTIVAIGDLGRTYPVDLVVAGDGDSADEVRAAAAAVNARLGRSAVMAIGPMSDPRPAYAAADIVVGMGTSAARAMLFEKPVVVVGEEGYAETFDADSAEMILGNGFYGYGPGGADAPGPRDHLDALVRDPDRRAVLGCFGREVVAERFSLPTVAGVLVERYEAAVRVPVRRDARRVAAALGRGLFLVAGYGLKSLIPSRVRQRFWFRHERVMRPEPAGDRG